MIQAWSPLSSAAARISCAHASSLAKRPAVVAHRDHDGAEGGEIEMCVALSVARA
jgi:hypothetical protein